MSVFEPRKSDSKAHIPFYITWYILSKLTELVALVTTHTCIRLVFSDKAIVHLIFIFSFYWNGIFCLSFYLGPAHKSPGVLTALLVMWGPISDSLFSKGNTEWGKGGTIPIRQLCCLWVWYRLFCTSEIYISENVGLSKFCMTEMCTLKLEGRTNRLDKIIQFPKRPQWTERMVLTRWNLTQLNA